MRTGIRKGMGAIDPLTGMDISLQPPEGFPGSTSTPTWQKILDVGLNIGQRILGVNYPEYAPYYAPGYYPQYQQQGTILGMSQSTFLLIAGAAVVLLVTQKKR